jgi:hypothetical protein
MHHDGDENTLDRTRDLLDQSRQLLRFLSRRIDHAKEGASPNDQRQPACQTGFSNANCSDEGGAPCD